MRYSVLTPLVRGGLLLGLCGCFLVQVRDQVNKYLSGSTTTAATTERDAALAFPTITICPR